MTNDREVRLTADFQDTGLEVRGRGETMGPCTVQKEREWGFSTTNHTDSGHAKPLWVLESDQDRFYVGGKKQETAIKTLPSYGASWDVLKC